MIVLVPTRLEMRRLFPELGEPPHDRRRRTWRDATSSRARVDVAWCGFGLASAGGGAAAILAERVEEACLAGFSGSLRAEALPVGSVVVATTVESHGVGLPRPSAASSDLDSELAVDPSLAPPPPPELGAALRAALGSGDLMGGMLSVAVPSVSPQEARERAAAHPSCLAEEMEALAVLHAAAALGRRISILRGVSNVAGERDKSSWRVDEAAAAVRAVLDRWLDAGTA